MDKELVLGRLGHYHVPGTGDGACQVAIVAHVTAWPAATSVNIAGFEHDGEPMRHLDVPVGGPQDHATFHLTRDCPFGR